MTNLAQNKDNTGFLIATVKEAYRKKSPLKIVAGNSKEFHGKKIDFNKVDISTHCGILNYEPSELVITARAGTPISSINSALKKNNQMLAFDPPDFNASSTIGGTIACGLSGSRRPFSGSARDFILGTRIINGKGEALRFGGEVIKNVAGYDASRLMTGALGTLGVLLDISIKVLPRPEQEITLVQNLSLDAALSKMTYLKRQAYPISGLVYFFNHLFIRLSGSTISINNAVKKMGGEIVNDLKNDFFFSWNDLDNHNLDFFKSEKPLWRISVKPNTPVLDIKGQFLYGWAGAERWLLSDSDNNEVFRKTAEVNGHATLFRFGDRSGEVFQPLHMDLLKLHVQLKKSFDPENILNPGKLYSEI
ncbi:MAG: glycolate oxidase subunit GlcE [Gammaproteobacteria bacterium]